jgi:hypothetical protein
MLEHLTEADGLLLDIRYATANNLRRSEARRGLCPSTPLKAEPLETIT